MKKNTAKSAQQQLFDPPDFSLVIGGPLFQLLRRAHLSDDALHLVRQRIVGAPKKADVLSALDEVAQAA